jgi:isorenieratene synthase
VALRSHENAPTPRRRRHVANARAALEMLRFDPQRTYALFDGMNAAAYLDSLAFPLAARRMLFDVFSHSFFNPEAEMSAAELLMMFHFYFTGNLEGLIFDVSRRPFSRAIWEPFAAWLSAQGVALHTAAAVRRVDGETPAAGVVEHEAGRIEAALGAGHRRRRAQRPRGREPRTAPLTHTVPA